MKINKRWMARIICLLIVALLLFGLNRLFTIVIGKLLSRNILQDEQVRNIVQLIRDSGVEYRKISTIMNSERKIPLVGFYIFTFILCSTVVLAYSCVMLIMRKLFHLDEENNI